MTLAVKVALNPKNNEQNEKKIIRLIVDANVRVRRQKIPVN